MTTGAEGTVRSIALDDLIALNDEIAALTRAGMPLGRGLLGVGGDLRGRLGAVARSLGGRMEGGASLAEALEAEGPGIPSTYRAVAEAGIRSGRLAEALEGMAGFVRSYVELRQAIGMALLYPLLVFSFAYGLFIVLVLGLMPVLVGAFGEMRVPVGGMMLGIAGLGRSVAIWGPILPIAVAVALAAWWRSGRTSAFRPGSLGLGWRWVPGVSSILDGGKAAQFASWLALLIDHDVPWSQAVSLAAEATGDPKLKASACEIAEASGRGQPPSESVRGLASIPPFLAWLMAQPGGQRATVSALRHAAETYHRRSVRRAEALRMALPAVLLLVIGASATFFYAMTLFAPWTGLLRGLTRLH